MNIVMPITNYKRNDDLLLFLEPIKNTIIENSLFHRLVFTNEFVTFNSIYLTIPLKNVETIKYFNKYKCNINENSDMVHHIIQFEQNMMKSIHLAKRPRFTILEQLKTGSIRLFSEKVLPSYNVSFTIILKFSGIWETPEEYGITFKFIYLEETSASK